MKCKICENEFKDGYFGICFNCLNSHAKTFELDNLPKRIFILECNDHGIYLSGATNGNCPNCIYTKCRICNKTSKLEKGICYKCLSTIPKSFKIDNLPDKIYILNCNEHGRFLAANARSICPTCLIPRCRICNEVKDLEHKICNDCIKATNKTFNLENIPTPIFILNCPDDGAFLADNIRPCPVCYNNCVFKCKKCDAFISNVSETCKDCGYSDYENYKFNCENCGNNLTSSLSTCNKCGYTKPRDMIVKCQKCEKPIDNNFSICKSCGYDFKKDFVFYCKKCNHEIPSPVKTCENCGYLASKDFNFRCKKCNSRISSALSKCETCGFIPQLEMEFKCKCCGSKLFSSLETCK